jgi:hypothetical protein
VHSESTVTAKDKRLLGVRLDGRSRFVPVRIWQLQCVRIGISGAQDGTRRSRTAHYGSATLRPREASRLPIDFDTLAGRSTAPSVAGRGMRQTVETYKAETLVRGWAGWGGPKGVEWTWTPCNFGGMRPWLVCPDCERRCAKLYWFARGGDYRRGYALRCRRCAGLTYLVQQVRPYLRFRLAQERLRHRLGGTGEPLEDFPAKPPRMHRRTYLGARELYVELAAAREAAEWRAFGRRITALEHWIEAHDAPSRSPRRGENQ